MPSAPGRVDSSTGNTATPDARAPATTPGSPSGMDLNFGIPPLLETFEEPSPGLSVFMESCLEFIDPGDLVSKNYGGTSSPGGGGGGGCGVEGHGGLEQIYYGTHEPDLPSVAPVFGDEDSGNDYAMPDLYVMFRDLKISRSAWGDDGGGGDGNFLHSLSNNHHDSSRNCRRGSLLFPPSFTPPPPTVPTIPLPPPTTLPVDRYGQYIVDDGCPICGDSGKPQLSLFFKEAQWWECRVGGGGDDGDYDDDDGGGGGDDDDDDDGNPLFPMRDATPYPDGGPGCLFSKPPACACTSRYEGGTSTLPGPNSQAPTEPCEDDYYYRSPPVKQEEPDSHDSPGHAPGADHATPPPPAGCQPRPVKKLRRESRRPTPARNPKMAPRPTPKRREEPRDIKSEEGGEELSPEARRRKIRNERQRLKRKALKYEAAAAAEHAAEKPTKRARTSVGGEKKTPQPRRGPKTPSIFRPKMVTTATATTTTTTTLTPIPNPTTTTATTTITTATTRKQGPRHSPVPKVRVVKNPKRRTTAAAVVPAEKKPPVKRRVGAVTRALAKVHVPSQTPVTEADTVQEEEAAGEEANIEEAAEKAPRQPTLSRPGAVTRGLASLLKRNPSQPAPSGSR